MRPGWRTSNEQLEALVRSHLTPESRVLDLGCGRGEADTFPVQYRANTERTIRALAGRVGMAVSELRVVRDPTYLAFNGLMFRASVISDGLLPASWGIHLLGDLERPKTS